MRTLFYKSRLFNDKLKVIARDFISKMERRGKEQGSGETERESVCERQTVVARRHSIGNKIGR